MCYQNSERFKRKIDEHIEREPYNFMDDNEEADYEGEEDDRI